MNVLTNVDKISEKAFKILRKFKQAPIIESRRTYNTTFNNAFLDDWPLFCFWLQTKFISIQNGSKT